MINKNKLAVTIFFVALLLFAFFMELGFSSAASKKKDKPIQTNSSNLNSWLYFDGDKDYVSVQDNKVLSVNNTGQLSISVWFNPETLSFKGESSGYVNFLGKGKSGQHEYTFRFYNSSNSEKRPNRISFYVFNLTGGYGTGSYFQDPIKAGEWVNIVAVVNGSDVSIFKNGVNRDNDTYYEIINPEKGNASLNFGTRDGNSYFNGSLDEIRIYNRTLSNWEINHLYNSGKNRNNSLTREGLAGYWSFDENNGSIAHDLSPYNNYGNIYGAKWRA